MITLFILILSLLFLLIILKMVILPWRKVNSYKKEGVDTYFFPAVGIFQQFQKSFKEKNDMMLDSKLSSKLHPNQKYLVTNVTDKILIFLRDPQYLREFLQRPSLYHKTDFVDFFKPFVGTGLVFSEDNTWKQHRRIISGSFHYEFLKANMPVIQETTTEFFQNLSPEDYKNYTVISRIQEITGEIVGRIFFGKNLNKYTFDGKPMTLELAEIMFQLTAVGRTPLLLFFGYKVMDFPLFPKLNKLMNKIRKFRQLCFKIVNDRKTNPSQAKDFLASLLETQKSDDPETRYSDEDIVNEFITFFVAGMDSTGHLIGMTLYNLTQYPEYLQELEKERKETYNKEEKATTEMLSKMEILHSLLKETLRFYPPGPFNIYRKALEDHKICDLEIRKGDLVTTDYSALFFDERHFKNPETFDPKRWRESEQKLDPYAFIPFSAGPRNCIGQHLAIIEAKVIISEFLKKFDFKLKDGYKLRMTLGFLYEPAEELQFNLSLKGKASK